MKKSGKKRERCEMIIIIFIIVIRAKLGQQSSRLGATVWSECECSARWQALEGELNHPTSTSFCPVGVVALIMNTMSVGTTYSHSIPGVGFYRSRNVSRGTWNSKQQHTRKREVNRGYSQWDELISRETKKIAVKVICGAQIAPFKFAFKLAIHSFMVMMTNR